MVYFVSSIVVFAYFQLPLLLCMFGWLCQRCDFGGECLECIWLVIWKCPEGCWFVICDSVCGEVGNDMCVREWSYKWCASMIPIDVWYC